MKVLTVDVRLFSSPSDQNLSVIPRCRKLFPFSSSSPEPLDQFQLGTKHPFVKGIQVCSNEGPRPFARGNNKEIAKIH